MSTTTLSSKFQFSVPKEVRETMRLVPGQQFEMIPMGSIIQLVPQDCHQRPARYCSRSESCAAA